MRIDSGNFGEQRRRFDGRLSLAGVWRRCGRPKLRALVWTASGGPFVLQDGSLGSIEEEEEAGVRSPDRRHGRRRRRRPARAGHALSSRAPSRPRRVGARGWSEKSGKNVEKYFMGVCAISFGFGLPDVSVSAPISLVLPENAVTG